MLIWVGLLFGLSGVIGTKALIALLNGQRYAWSWWDGGALMRGRETSPAIVLGVAGAMALVATAATLWAFVLR